MIAFSGQLGNAALGSLELAHVPVYGTFTPHRGRALSSVTANTTGSAVRRGFKVNSAVRAAVPRSEVGNG